MSSSERKHYLRFAHARFVGDEPFHAFARDLVGNIDHLADQFSQHRVRWVARSASHYFEPEIGAGSIVADTFYRLWQSDAFDLHVRETGESYSLRLRLRAARSAGSGTLTFRVVVAAQGIGRAYYADVSQPNVASAECSSATHAWLELHPPIVHLDLAQVIQATRASQSTDELGGEVIAGRWLRCTAEVWASTTSAASVPRLSGLQVSEYYPP